jgi:hypothetical protein
MTSQGFFMSDNTSRRNFLKTAALASVSASIATLAGGCAGGSSKTIISKGGMALATDLDQTRQRPAGQKPVHDLTTPSLDKVRVGLIGAGLRGSAHIRDLLDIEFAQIVAVCDLRQERAERMGDTIEKARGKRPAVYGGTENIFEKLCERDDLDVIYIVTPWEWHTPMALKTMEQGKHAFVEVPAAVTVNDCWRLLNTSERTQRHCIMLENCCYGENELFVLNMARKGVFGELTNAECGYLHDLREKLFDLEKSGLWRRRYHTLYNGNLYPTHGLGPVAQYLGVGRGDQFKFLVSMSSPEKGLSKWRADHNPNGGKQAREKYICGDMNTSIIKTELGRTITIQHNIVSPRPYSRINALAGTEATFSDYPARLAINTPAKYGLAAKGSQAWLNDADMKKMRKQFTHPLWSNLQKRAANSGHGGMDFVMSYRHLDCIRKGVTPDSVAYDAAAWSCIFEISVRSVAAGSMPVTIPDFTRGLWKKLQPLPI